MWTLLGSSPQYEIVIVNEKLQQTTNARNCINKKSKQRFNVGRRLEGQSCPASSKIFSVLEISLRSCMNVVLENDQTFSKDVCIQKQRRYKDCHRCCIGTMIHLIAV